MEMPYQRSPRGGAVRGVKVPAAAARELNSREHAATIGAILWIRFISGFLG
jgi:hypothetical protein